MTGYYLPFGADYAALSARLTRGALGDLAIGVNARLGITLGLLCDDCGQRDSDAQNVTFSTSYGSAFGVLCWSCQEDHHSCSHCSDVVLVASWAAQERIGTALRATDRLNRYDNLTVRDCDDCGLICNDCSEELNYCEECDVAYCDSYSHSECGCSDEESYYGDNTDSLPLLPYSHKPRAIFHGRETDPSAPTFGMELETAYVTSEHVRTVNALGNGEAWYAKADCSVRGAEFVSHPRTYASWCEHLAELEPVLARMIADGANNGEIDGNGIHVHVGRDAFTGRAHLARFALLIDNGHAWVTKLARRDNSEWSSFGNVKRHRSNRYSDRRSSALFSLTSPYGGIGARGAVNLQNGSTVEVRVWRQSLDSQHVLQAVGFVAAAVEYTKTLTVQECMAGALTGEAFTEWLSFRPEYAPVLADLVTIFPNVEAPAYLAPVS